MTGYQITSSLNTLFLK